MERRAKVHGGVTLKWTKSLYYKVTMTAGEKRLPGKGNMNPDPASPTLRKNPKRTGPPASIPRRIFCSRATARAAPIFLFFGEAGIRLDFTNLLNMAFRMSGDF